MNYRSRTVSKVVTSITTGVDADLIYKVPPRFEAEVDLLLISNFGSGNKKISLQIKSNGGAYSYLVKNLSVSANSFFNLLGSSIMHLNEGDEIRGYVEDSSSDFVVTISLKQFPKGVVNV